MCPSPRRWGRFSDDGTTSIELAIGGFAMVLLLALVILAGRVSSAHHAIDHVATAAARAASLARTPNAAEHAARATTARVLHEQGLHCRHSRLTVDTSALATAPGRPGMVRVTVHCSVPLTDLALPGLPGRRLLTAHFASPVDPFRGRGS